MRASECLRLDHESGLESACMYLPTSEDGRIEMLSNSGRHPPMTSLILRLLKAKRITAADACYAVSIIIV